MTTLQPWPHTAAPLAGPATFRQRWDDVALVHWAVDPETVEPLLPQGVVPDVLDGATYVGLVAFRMTRVAIGPGPFVPWLGQFLETNIRLYGADGEGRHGVVFRSLDAERLLTVAAIRAFYRLPYAWARMTSSVVGGVHRYEMRRRWPGPRGIVDRLAVRPGPRVDPSPLEDFLTARYGLHSALAGRLLWTPNVHTPWELHRAELVDLDDGLAAAAGLGPLGDPVSVLWSPGVDTSFGVPRRVRP